MLTLATVVLAALFRSACVGSSEPRKLYRYLISGAWLGLAGWTLGAVLQVWVPVWQMLVAGVALALICAVVVPARYRAYARPAADFLIIALSGVLSVIPVRPVFLIGAALAFALAGFVIDRISALLIGPRLRPLLLAMPVVLVAVLCSQVRQPGNFGSRLLDEDPLFPLRAALVVPSYGTRVALDNGNVAWLTEARNGEARGTAVVLHGNHRYGSSQPSGLVLQGALMRAGYDVLAVDHPGFGASLVPAANAAWYAWDPTSGAIEALRYLHSRKTVIPHETIVVGHSMGVDVALKLVADGTPAKAVYLWGGSLDRPHGPNWLSGFHRERNIPCCLPTSVMERIRDEFYGGGDRFAAALPANHTPVHFVRFGIEHADVTRDREPLYAAISEPKHLCDFDEVSHYFNTLALRGFVLIDTLTLRRTAEILAPESTPDAACGRG